LRDYLREKDPIERSFETEGSNWETIWDRRIQFTHSYRISLWFILILLSHTLLHSNIYISNKMHMLQSLFYLTTALHVSGVTSPIFRSTKQL